MNGMYGYGNGYGYAPPYTPQMGTGAQMPQRCQVIKVNGRNGADAFRMAADSSDYSWNVAMNMMYSDYCTVANKYNVGTPEFYACMAKAFLFDKDAKSPNAKMAAYYFGIVDVE